MLKFFVHTDSGHGWLAVKRALLAELGLLSRVSHCSYERGASVYLEEDADATMFLNELRSRGIEFAFKESRGRWVDRSPVRSYACFSLRPGEGV